MAGFDPVAARQMAEGFAEHLAQVRKEAPEVMEQLQNAWAVRYQYCGHKALGRLMVGKSVDEACRSFER